MFAAYRKETANTFRKDASFACAGSGNYEQRTIAKLYDLTLGR